MDPGYRCGTLRYGVHDHSRLSTVQFRPLVMPLSEGAKVPVEKPVEKQTYINSGTSTSDTPWFLYQSAGPYTGFNDGGGKAQFSTTGGGQGPQISKFPQNHKGPPLCDNRDLRFRGGGHGPPGPPCIRACQSVLHSGIFAVRWARTSSSNSALPKKQRDGCERT